MSRSPVAGGALDGLVQESRPGRCQRSRLVTSHRPGELVELRLVLPLTGTDPAGAVRAELVARATLSSLQADVAGAGLVSCETRPDRVVVAARTTRGGLDEVLTLLLDRFVRWSVPPGTTALADERSAMLTRWSRAAASPMSQAREAFLLALHGEGSRFAHEGRPASTDALPEGEVGSDELVTTSAQLAVVGDCDHGRIHDAMDQVTHRSDAAPAGAPAEDRTHTAGIAHRAVPGCPQDLIRIGCLTVARQHPDYAALQVAALALGGYPRSRLTRVLRERQGLAYAPRALMDPVGPRAAFVIEADVTPGTWRRAIPMIVAEHAAVARDRETLAQARRFAVGSMTLACSSRAGLASVLASLVANELPVSWLHSYDESIMATSDDQVVSAQERHCPPSAWAGVVVTGTDQQESS